jgi:hypothetical protein
MHLLFACGSTLHLADIFPQFLIEIIEGVIQVIDLIGPAYGFPEDGL